MSDRRRYHPTDFGPKQWQRLLSFALGRSDEVEVAVPYVTIVQDLAASPLWPPALEARRNAVTDRSVSLIRWGRLQDTPTQFVRLSLTADVRRYVRRLGPLERWSWRRSAPEDPTFLCRGAVVLATESGTGRISVFADTRDFAALTDSGVRLLEPLGAEAEPWPTP